MVPRTYLQVSGVFLRIEEVLETFRNLFGEESHESLHLILTLGRTYERLSHLQKARETYERGLSLAESRDDSTMVAMMLCRLGHIFSRLNLWDEALTHLDRSGQAFTELNDEGGLARVAINRGVVFFELGDFDRAAELYTEARELAQRSGDLKIASNAGNNLAVLAKIRGDLNDAVAQYQACLSVSEQLSDHRVSARIYYNLGYRCRAELLLELGDSSMAATCCARALEIYRQMGNRLREADAYRCLGKVFTAKRQWSIAGSLFEDSVRLNEEYQHPLGVAQAQRDEGKMHAARNRKTNARASFEEARSGFQELGLDVAVKEVEDLIGTLDD